MAFMEDVQRHKFSILRAAALVVGIVLVGAATIDVYVDTMEAADPAGAAAGETVLVLNMTEMPTAGVAIVTVDKASTNLTWGQLKMVMSGSELAYDTNATKPGTFCVSNGEETCTPPEFHPASAVDAGDEIHVHHPDVEGKTLRVVERATNAMIASAKLNVTA